MAGGPNAPSRGCRSLVADTGDAGLSRSESDGGERPDPRRTAFRVLEQVERGRRLDRAWESFAPALAGRDRPWVHELTHGVVRLRGRLDHLLDLHLRKGLGSVRPEVAIHLRMGAYQLLYMGSVPVYAAVSETVDEVRRTGGGGLAGMANGVLRALAREGGEPERFPSFDRDPRAHLATWGSHPRWLVDRWVDRWGAGAVLKVVEHANRVPRLYLRVLRSAAEPPAADGDVERAVRTLVESGIEAVPGPADTGTIALGAGADPSRVLALVPGVVQDPAAAGVVRWIGTVDGLDAADLCAAPGGKSMGLWSGGARVVACDASFPRLERVREAARRLGAGVPLVAARAEEPAVRPRDLILVDAPCTGTGTLARHPDARWRLTPGDVARMARVQDRILDGAAECVAAGGLLVYSTCSLEPEENDERIEAFLGRHPEFRIEAPMEGRPDRFRVLPQDSGTDGAFAVRLRRWRDRAEPSFRSGGRTSRGIDVIKERRGR